MTPPHAGTDATHADHIETIKTRNYVGVEPNGGFVPGELGMGLVEGKKKTLRGDFQVSIAKQNMHVGQ